MSNYPDQVPFADPVLAENPEPRCPCLLLLDTSASMDGEPIKELNDGIIKFKDELMADALAVKRVELGLVTFGPVRVETDFQTADVFQPPMLIASGDTPMGAAILQGLDLLTQKRNLQTERNLDLSSVGFSHY